MADDKILIDKYIKGDNKSSDILVKKYEKQIYAFTYRITKNMEDAMDITQDTFIKAFEKIRGFRGVSSFKTWLYQIALNTCLDFTRKQKPVYEQISEEHKNNQRTALSDMIDKEEKAQLRNALNELPQRQRIAVILRVYEDLSLKEAASIMRCSEGAIKAHYHNGIKKLKNVLKEHGYEVKS
ncbi:ECF subfamily RNA polymerase sigma-24 subunit [Candidatus Magnetoovum chiemensis]|nr:ECF subfamily RNA polymerase sigma-24 subunit [Candidatus Magnetoovum chiemensis]